MLKGLVVRPEAIARNLDHLGELIVAGAVMLAFAPDMVRLKAHDVVYAACRQAIGSSQTLLDVLRADPKVVALLGEDASLRLTSPAEHLAIAPEVVDRILEGR